MDAAVMNPQIMTDVNGNSNAANAELEVKKLQELVRKLERQNEQLRTRANGCTGSPHILPPSPAYMAGSYCIPSPLPTLLCQSSLESFFPLDEPFEYLHSHYVDTALETEADYMELTVLDEVDILDLDAVFSNEDSEATWLYVSAKARLWGESPVTPLQWSRQVLDSPRTEVESARSLCLRLDQVHRWRGVFSSHSSPAPPLRRVAGVSPLSASFSRSCSTPPPADRPASFSSPLHPLLHLSLTPIGKAERIPTFLPANHSANRSRSLRRFLLSPQSSMDSELSASELEDDSITQGYKLQDLVDVQVMARLQEDSLRQDYATTPTSINRRSASFSFLSLQHSGEADLEEEEDEEEYGQLPPPQPRLTRVGPTLQRGLSHSHTFSSIRDWRRSTTSLSSPSTPQYPSGGFSYQPPPQPQALASPTLSTYTPEQQGFRPGSDKLRRSMPNLFRAPSVPSPLSPANHIGSPSTLRNSLSFDSSNGLASRLQSSIPSPGQLQNRVQSVGNFQSLSRQPLKATAYVSPTVKGPVTMPTSTSLQSLSGISGIPLSSKPGVGVGGTPTPPRSSLPRPASFIGTSATPRSKIAQPTRSLLTPKSLSSLSALRDGSWRDGCY
ncbi:SLAIN motif-containing protein 1-like isoform X1 [Salvelinus fontinalis]|uniref:SLAIN motif-containing protein 1-like isoform X1 n=1 Tax=Salvelinus fontinalis TaxID=8038 RepID=UPI002485D15A|nr:SLAIN motif-containing protein 1-like isoform X1 [Salvelinus fontinalis]